MATLIILSHIRNFNLILEPRGKFVLNSDLVFQVDRVKYVIPAPVVFKKPLANRSRAWLIKRHLISNSNIALSQVNEIYKQALIKDGSNLNRVKLELVLLHVQGILRFQNRYFKQRNK